MVIGGGHRDGHGDGHADGDDGGDGAKTQQKQEQFSTLKRTVYGSFRNWGYLKIGVLITRILLFGYYVRVPYFRKFPCGLVTGSAERSLLPSLLLIIPSPKLSMGLEFRV